jgi:DNA-binding response OmpR family regulator
VIYNPSAVSENDPALPKPLPEPADVRQLLAQVQTLLRTASASAPPPTRSTHLVHFGAVVIDLERRLVLRHDVPVSVTPREYALLLVLAERRGAAIHRDELLKLVWDDHQAAGPAKRRTVDQHICRLRRKIETNPARPQHILTVQGWGYRLAGL